MCIGSFLFSPLMTNSQCLRKVRHISIYFLISAFLFLFISVPGFLINLSRGKGTWIYYIVGRVKNGVIRVFVFLQSEQVCFFFIFAPLSHLHPNSFDGNLSITLYSPMILIQPRQRNIKLKKKISFTAISSNC